MSQEINALIKNYNETKDEKYFRDIVQKMTPLLNSYAKKLYYLEFDDSMQELSITLYIAVISIQSFDNNFACLAYLKQAILHKFYKLYSQSVKEKRMIDKRVQSDSLEVLISGPDERFNSMIVMHDLYESIKHKTDTEKQIIYMLILGYSDQEITHFLGYSRQYINRLKKKIISIKSILKLQ